jgi:hypothetical protein
MPVRPRVVSNGAANSNLGHRNSPFCGASRNLEPSNILGITLLRCHQNYTFTALKGQFLSPFF